MTKKHIYKVYRNNAYIGSLSDVRSDFAYGHEINSAGTMITIEIAKSVDTSVMAPDFIMTESDDFLTTEDDLLLTTERAYDLIGDSSDNILMREGNKIIVIEYNDYSPNGKQMFSGSIKHVEAEFGENVEDLVTLYVYSDAYDLNGHVVPGSNSLFSDQSQTTQDNFLFFQGTVAGTNYFVAYGQTFTTGASVTNLAAIDIMLAYTGAGYGQQCTVWLYNSQTDYQNGVPPFGFSTVVVTAATPTVFRAQFPAPISVNPNQQYFFLVTCTTQTDVNIYFKNSSAYTGGDSFYQFIGYPAWSTFIGTDLYFTTYYSNLTTKSIFTSQDPSNMLLSAMTSYSSEGGLVTANSGTVDLTGLSIPYTFNLATTLELIQTVKSMAPAGFYYYVDLGTNLLYFKQTATTADFTLIRGRHINSIKLVSTIENVKNKIFFTGGDTGGGNNYYSSYSDYNSILSYGISIDRISDNRIITQAPADAVGQSYLAQNKNKQYQTRVTILANSMDITLLKPGKNITFRGFGSFVDSLIIQIVRVDYLPDRATVTLGALPPRVDAALTQAIADITALQTVDNPAIPS